MAAPRKKTAEQKAVVQHFHEEQRNSGFSAYKGCAQIGKPADEKNGIQWVGAIDPMTGKISTIAGTLTPNDATKIRTYSKARGPKEKK